MLRVAGAAMFAAGLVLFAGQASATVMVAQLYGDNDGWSVGTLQGPSPPYPHWTATLYFDTSLGVIADDGAAGGKSLTGASAFLGGEVDFPTLCPQFMGACTSIHADLSDATSFEFQNGIYGLAISVVTPSVSFSSGVSGGAFAGMFGTSFLFSPPGTNFSPDQPFDTGFLSMNDTEGLLKATDGTYLADDFLQQIIVQPVPEPSTWALMLVGFFGLGSAVRGAKSSSDRRSTARP